MIRLEHIKTFDFGGNVDDWGRIRKSSNTLTDEIWFEIESIVQNLTIINNGIAAESFKTQTFEHMKTVCENEGVIQALLELSKK